MPQEPTEKLFVVMGSTHAAQTFITSAEREGYYGLRLAPRADGTVEIFYRGKTTPKTLTTLSAFNRYGQRSPRT